MKSFEDYIREKYDNADDRLSGDIIFDYDIEDMRQLYNHLTKTFESDTLEESYQSKLAHRRNHD